MKFTLMGEELKIDEEGNYNGIPENCPECHCSQSPNYKDFTCHTVHVCEQCGTEMYLKGYYKG